MYPPTPWVHPDDGVRLPGCSGGLPFGLHALHRDRYRSAHRVAHRRVVPGKRQQVVELLSAAVGFDLHVDLDRLVTDRYAVIQRQQPLQVHVTGQFGGQLLDPYPAGSRVQYRGGGHAAGQRVQQILDRVGPIVVAEQDRRLTIGEDKGLLPRRVLGAGAVEILNGGTIGAAIDPLVACPKLEVSQ